MKNQITSAVTPLIGSFIKKRKNSCIERSERNMRKASIRSAISNQVSRKLSATAMRPARSARS